MKKPKLLNIKLEDFINEDQFFAIRALEEGKANEAQQKVALKAIAHNIAGLLQPSYDESNPTNTAFNEGRRWVGRFIFEVLGVAPASYFKPKQTKNNNKII